MILEYVAHDALAQLRHTAAPVTLGTAVISRGLEDHASFSTHAIRAANTAARAYRTILACELLAATRALRLAETTLPRIPLRDAYQRADAALPHIAEDHSLTGEVQQAEQLLDTFADL